MEDKKELVFKKMSDAGKPLKTGDIAEITGINKDDISKLIKDLKNEGKIFSPKRCFYQTK